MPAEAPPRGRRWRLWLLLAAVATLFAGVLVLRWLLQPERMGALILERAAQATGLQLTVSAPARLAVFPGLHLELVGLQARADAGASPLLVAERIDLALPLSVLWSEQPEIGRIDLLAPRLDLVAIAAWREGVTDSGPPEPLRLPDFATTVRLERGRLEAPGLRLGDLEGTLSPLRDGQPLTLQLAGTLTLGQRSGPLRLDLGATPVQHDAGISLRELELRLGHPNAAGDAARAAGEIDLWLPQRLRLDLRLHPEQFWLLPVPELPAPLPELLALPTHLHYDGSIELEGELRLVATGEQSRYTLTATPQRLRAWLDDPAAAPLPPAALGVEATMLEVEGVRLHGVRLQLEEDAPTP